jgi:hypothetical protein
MAVLSNLYYHLKYYFLPSQRPHWRVDTDVSRNQGAFYYPTVNETEVSVISKKAHTAIFVSFKLGIYLWFIYGTVTVGL